MTADRYDAYETLKAEAAKTLDLPIEAERVQTLASLRLAHRLLTERMIAGNAAEASNLLAVSEAISRLSPPAGPTTIRVVLVPPTDAAPPGEAAVDDLRECRRCHWRPDSSDRVSKCYRCGWTRGADMNAPWVSPLNVEPQVIDGEVAKPAPVEAKQLPPQRT